MFITNALVLRSSTHSKFFNPDRDVNHARPS